MAFHSNATSASALSLKEDGLTTTTATDTEIDADEDTDSDTSEKKDQESVTSAVTKTFLDTLSKLGMDIPQLGGNSNSNSNTNRNTNSEFFDKETMATQAIAQALEQIRNVTGVSEEEALEMMDDDLKEQILGIVDEAYASFAEEIQEIRENQVVELEEKVNAIQKESDKGLNKQEKRLDDLYNKLKKSVDGLKEEQGEMESALKGDDDPKSDKLLSQDALQNILKQDGLILNALLAGTILFSLRSLMEVVFYMESHSSHHMSLAILQGGVAMGFLSTLLYFFGNDILKAYEKSTSASSTPQKS